MKQSHIMIIAVFIVLVLGGWLFTLTAKEEGKQDLMKAKLQEAEDLENRGLLQKTVLAYDEALDIDENILTRMKLIHAAERRYAEDKHYYEKYLEYALEAAREYPKHPYFSTRVAKLYLDQMDYQSAHDFLVSVKAKGLNDVVVTRIFNEALYAFREDWLSYTDIKYAGTTHYAVETDGHWAYIDETGNDQRYGKLTIASPPSKEGFRYIQKNGEDVLIDSEKVIQAYLDFTPEDVGFFAEELIALKKDGKFRYFDHLGDEIFGSYDEAGAFIESKAAVKDGDKWFLIDKEGNAISENRYDEIVLDLSGHYLVSGHFLAKSGDSYQIYTAEETPVEGFSCQEVDVLTEDGIFAFKRDDKWGFANLAGEVIIEPQYEDARSFSNGLAAVYNGDMWGFVNQDNYAPFEFRFLEVSYFNKQRNCMVQLEEGKWSLFILQVK